MPSPAPETNETSDRTFLEKLLGKPFLSRNAGPDVVPSSRSRAVLVPIAVLGALLYLPYLGAVGLWDAWESHYGEVARAMIQRSNYVVPFWEHAPFFSKPPLIMWMDILGMWLVGTVEKTGRNALYTEWAMRLPTALFSIGALCLLALALARTVGRRVAFAAVFALSTMPLYFLLSRQVITDTPFVSALTCAMACALIALFDETSNHRAAWWYGFYFFCGLAMLAKELLGVALPGAILVLYAVFCVLPWDGKSWVAHGQWLVEPNFRARVRQGEEPMPVLWDYLYKMHFGTGLLIFAAVALPWLLTMVFCAQGRDPENETFVYRYFIHDQLGRLTAGVHSTEHEPPFTYFIQQGGYGIFPWVAVVPGALFVALKNRLRALDVRSHVTWIAVFWTLLSFTLMSSSATKFPHYIFPALPGLAILMGLYIKDLWDEGIERHALALMMGFVLFALVAHDLATGPNRDGGRSYVGVPIYTGGLKAFTDLIAYNHDRPYPIDLVLAPLGRLFGQEFNLRMAVSWAFLAAGVFLVFSALSKARLAVFTGFTALALAWTLWFSWGHWVNLSHHWTQRDLFWRYYDKARPGEPIAAFQMDWKGETFYSRNTVKQVMTDGKLAEYFKLPGRKWVLVEQGDRLRIVQQIASGHQVQVYDPDLNAKLTIVSVD